jgi:hypothetical protein
MNSDSHSNHLTFYLPPQILAGQRWHWPEWMLTMYREALNWTYRIDRVFPAVWAPSIPAIDLGLFYHLTNEGIRHKLLILQSIATEERCACEYAQRQ